MISAASDPPPLSPPARRSVLAALALSLLVHVLAALLWLGVPLPVPEVAENEEERPIAVEIVPAPKPEPVRPEAPKPPPSAPPDKLTPPQMAEAPVADRSAIGRQGRDAGKGAVAVPGKKLTRSERDVVLGQVLRQWQPPRDLAAFPEATITVEVVVRADGSLAPPFSSALPWNPGAAIDGYESLAPGDLTRLTTEAFYRALRAAQPFRLPESMKAKAPIKLTLAFRYRDVR